MAAMSRIVFLYFMDSPHSWPYRIIFYFYFSIGYKGIKFCAKEKGEACFLHHSSRLFSRCRMTIYRLLSFCTVVRILCKKAGKRSCDTEWKIYHSDDVLPAFLTTGIDPSHLFRMTSHRPLSFWAEAKMPYKKTGKWQCDTEWKIYHFNDVLWSSLPWEQTLHIRFGWRLAVRCHSEWGKNTLWERQETK